MGIFDTNFFEQDQDKDFLMQGGDCWWETAGDCGLLPNNAGSMDCWVFPFLVA